MRGPVLTSPSRTQAAANASVALEAWTLSISASWAASSAASISYLSSVASIGPRVLSRPGLGDWDLHPARSIAAAVLLMESSKAPLTGASSRQKAAMVLQKFGSLEAIGGIGTVQVRKVLEMDGRDWT